MRQSARILQAGFLGLFWIGGCLVSDDAEDDDVSSQTSTTVGMTAGTQTACVCQGPADCALGQTCDGCVCVDSTETDSGVCEPGYGIGAFGDCVNLGQSSCGRLDAYCTVDVLEDPLFGVCSIPCTDRCDCPAPPGNGTAEVVCAEAYDGSSACLLDCRGGRACPLGMACVYDSICVHLKRDEVVEPYEDCVNGSVACNDSACILIGGDGTSADPDVGACFSTCETLIECPQPPPGAAVGCAPFDLQSGESVGLCYLDCSEAPCPEGMACVNSVCGWPEVEEGSSSSTGSGGSSSEDSGDSSDSTQGSETSSSGDSTSGSTGE